jgi:hypothetical protein
MKAAPAAVAKIKIRKIRTIRRESFVGLSSSAPVDSRLAAPVWHVSIEGGDPVGPVSADQIARGLRSGRVPARARVRHERDSSWSDLLDIRDVIAALEPVSRQSDLADESPSSIAPGLLVREFMVSFDGGDAVGPVSADQIARGIRAGKVPTEASLQRLGDLFAFNVLDEPDVIAALHYATK